MGDATTGPEEGREQLWLGEGDLEPASGRPGGRRRRVGAAAAAVVCVALVGVPVGFALTSGGSGGGHATRGHHAPSDLASGPAEHRVVAALGATVQSGSFAITYGFSEACPSTTTATPSPSAGGCSGTAGLSTPITGKGIIDTDPFAMVATSSVPGAGQVVLRDNGTDLWEQGGADYGLTPGSTNAGGGSPLAGIATLVESTIGDREGAVAMQGLASPTGYLTLAQEEITGATSAGSSTVDGAAVTVYRVSVTDLQDPTAADLTAEEGSALKAADALLMKEGYAGTTAWVSIDGSGYIRRVVSETRFSNGETVTNNDTLSDFGCAGTVLMPGQQGTPTPPTGCVSPDTGVAPTTTTSTTPSTTTTSTTPSTTTTSTTPSTTTTSTTPSPTTSSTTPSPTTSTTPSTTTTSTTPSTTTSTSTGVPAGG